MFDFSVIHIVHILLFTFFFFFFHRKNPVFGRKPTYAPSYPHYPHFSLLLIAFSSLAARKKIFCVELINLQFPTFFSYFPLTSFDTGLFGSGSHQGSAAAMKLTSEAVTGINEKLIKIVFAITLYFLSLSKKYAILKSSQIKELIVCVIRSLEEISK